MARRVGSGGPCAMLAVRSRSRWRRLVSIWRSRSKELVTDCYLLVKATGESHDGGSMVRTMLKTNPFGPTRPRLPLRRALPTASFVALAFALLLALLAPRAQAAGADQYGQVQRFGGFDASADEGKAPTAGKLLDPRGFAVDTQDGTGGAHIRLSMSWIAPPSAMAVRRRPGGSRSSAKPARYSPQQPSR